MDKVAILKAFFPDHISPSDYARVVAFVEGASPVPAPAPTENVGSRRHRSRSPRASAEVIAAVSSLLVTGSASIKELAKASGYSESSVYYALVGMGAPVVGTRPRVGDGAGRGTSLYGLPSKTVAP